MFQWRWQIKICPSCVLPVFWSPSCPVPFIRPACFISPCWNAACMQSPPSPLPIPYRMIQWMGFISNESTQRMGGVRRNLPAPAVPWYQSQLHTLSPWDVSSAGKLVYVCRCLYEWKILFSEHHSTFHHSSACLLFMWTSYIVVSGCARFCKLLGCSQTYVRT